MNEYALVMTMVGIVFVAIVVYALYKEDKK